MHNYAYLYLVKNNVSMLSYNILEFNELHMCGQAPLMPADTFAIVIVILLFSLCQIYGFRVIN